MGKDKPERKEILAAIGAFSQCLDPSFLESIYESDCKQLLEMSEKVIGPSLTFVEFS